MGCYSCRGVGRSRILGEPSTCMWVPATNNNQKMSANDIILGVQGVEPPEALAILCNLWVKSLNSVPFSLQTGYSKEYQLWLLGGGRNIFRPPHVEHWGGRASLGTKPYYSITQFPLYGHYDYPNIKGHQSLTLRLGPGPPWPPGSYTTV